MKFLSVLSKFPGLPWVMFLGYPTVPDQISEICLTDSTLPTNITMYTTRAMYELTLDSLETNPDSLSLRKEPADMLMYPPRTLLSIDIGNI